MNERVFMKLEYDRVLSSLASFCATAHGRGMAAALKPLGRLDAVNAALDETDQSRAFLDAGHRLGALALPGDPEEIRRALKRGLQLEPSALRAAAERFRLAGRLREKIDSFKDRFAALSRIRDALRPDPDYVEAIDRAIDEKDVIRDGASPELKKIRRGVAELDRAIPLKLHALFPELERARSLQERLVTLRNGRYVVPLKAEAAARTPGALQDRSASGHTAFVEPVQIMEHNNRLAGLRIDERIEIERILRELTDWTARRLDPLLENERAVGVLDFWQARGRLSGEHSGQRPRLTSERRISLRAARHPLLGAGAVPIDLDLGGDATVLIVSGPNAGGKTVALKTLGLLPLMAQSGLHVPAGPGTVLPVFKSVEAVIGDEQSIEKSQSTFSSHLASILQALDAAGPDSLTLIDEICTGTGVEEGAALASAILLQLLEKGGLVLVTTHQSHLKAFASATPGAQNARVAFDDRNQTPLYRIEPGAPGRSCALETARRLGYPASLLREAERLLDPALRGAEALLEDLDRARSQAGEERLAAEKLRRALEEKAAKLDKELREIKEKEKAILEKARGQAEKTLDDARETAEALLSRASQADSLPERAAVKGELKELTAARPSGPSSSAGNPKPVRAADLRPGARVFLKSGGREAVILQPPDKAGKLEVAFGALKMRVKISEIRELAPPPEIRRPSAADAALPEPGPFEKEIDLRGMRVEEALDALESGLQSSFMSGVAQVRVIHGYGTGALMKAVRERLRSEPLAESVQPGAAREGGAGVTVVRLSNRPRNANGLI